MSSFSIANRLRAVFSPADLALVAPHLTRVRRASRENIESPDDAARFGEKSF
jgi:hypothetical protein